MTTNVFFTYMVECADGTYYTGYTTNLDRRIRAHNEGKTGAKYTRSRRPVKLVYYEEYDNRHDAMAREAMIKKLSRQQKEKLLQGTDPSRQA
ncbi:MAG: GIY-YIG nuclease family protein [Candidatus Weimeria sp.]|nr:GIY-YIG nuclease family protein [Candidatus Weimeria sp.]